MPWRFSQVSAQGVVAIETCTVEAYAMESLALSGKHEAYCFRSSDITDTDVGHGRALEKAGR